MELNERLKLIDLYKDGYRVVAEALLRITPEELDARPRPDAWSAREVVHHLADSEMSAALRLRAILAEDRPTIHGYNQDDYARRLHYDRPHEVALELFRYARAATGELLDLMTPADWIRDATHDKAGAFGAERWLQIYSGHAHKHARQILTARASAKKAEA